MIIERIQIGKGGKSVHSWFVAPNFQLDLNWETDIEFRYGPSVFEFMIRLCFLIILLSFFK